MSTYHANDGLLHKNTNVWLVITNLARYIIPNLEKVVRQRRWRDVVAWDSSRNPVSERSNHYFEGTMLAKKLSLQRSVVTTS